MPASFALRCVTSRSIGGRRAAWLSRRLHLKSKRTAERKLADPRSSITERSGLTASHAWSPRNIAAPRLVNIHDVIKFIFFTSNTPWDIKWDIKMRICCGDCSSIDARWRVICINIFFNRRRIRRCIRKIYPIQLNGKWQLAKEKKAAKTSIDNNLILWKPARDKTASHTIPDYIRMQIKEIITSHCWRRGGRSIVAKFHRSLTPSLPDWKWNLLV